MDAATRAAQPPGWPANLLATFDSPNFRSATFFSTAFILVTFVIAASSGLAQQSVPAAGRAKASAPHAAPAMRASSLTEEQRALHALNRLTFGPRPGDLQKVMNMDVNDWIEQQLHPEEISDSVLDGKLGAFRTLRMSTRDLVQTFPNNNLVKSAAEGKIPLPTDPLKRSIYEVQIRILAERQKQDQSARDGKNLDADAKAKMDKQNQEAAAAQADGILSLPKEKRMEAILSLPPDERRLFVTNLRGGQRDRLLAELAVDQREAFLAMIGPVGVAPRK